MSAYEWVGTASSWVLLYAPLTLSVAGLLLNAATAAYFTVAVARRPAFTSGWCVAALAAADSLTLGLIILPSLQGLGWGLSDSGFVNFCLPNFFVHFASAFSAWVLFLLSLCHYVMVWHALDFARWDWLRRPLVPLCSILLVCVAGQLYIPFTLHFEAFDSEYGICVESFGMETGNWLLLADGILNFLLPTVASLALSVPALVPPGLRSDKLELAAVRQDEGPGQASSASSLLGIDTPRALSSGAWRETARLSAGRRKMRWLALLALGKLACNVPSQVFRVLDAVAPQMGATTSRVFPVAYLLYYAQFCGQALFIFFLFASRNKKRKPALAYSAIPTTF